MPDAEPSLTLPAASVRTILAAAGRPQPYDLAMIDTLGEWLGDALTSATRRARQRPLTRADVDKLERAYLGFHDAVQALQERAHPPPAIPIRDDETDWGHWIATQRAFGLKPGRREGTDWQFVGELIALYEAVSDRSASAAQPTGPTMRFLQAAMRELADHAPADVRSNFRSPDHAALRSQLVVLRKGYFRFFKQEIDARLNRNGGANPA